MKILKAVRRCFLWIHGLFRKKPVYVVRHFWDFASQCEVEAVVEQGILYPYMRIDEIIADMNRGVRFNKSHKEMIEVLAQSLPKENP